MIMCFKKETQKKAEILLFGKAAGLKEILHVTQLCPQNLNKIILSHYRVTFFSYGLCSQSSLSSPWRPPDLWPSCTAHCWCRSGWTAGLPQSCSADRGRSCWRSTCWSPTSSALCQERPPARSRGSTGRSSGPGIHSNAAVWCNLDQKKNPSYDGKGYVCSGKTTPAIGLCLTHELYSNKGYILKPLLIVPGSMRVPQPAQR